MKWPLTIKVVDIFGCKHTVFVRYIKGLSFLVDKIDGTSSYTLTLSNNDTIPLSKKTYDELNEIFTELDALN